MSSKEKGMPWLSIVGVLSIISLFFLQGNIMTLLPIYAVEGLLMIALGLELVGAIEQGKPKFRETMVTGMTVVWLVNQVLILIGMGTLEVFMLWTFAVVQLLFAYQFFTGEDLFNFRFKFSADAALLIVTVFAFIIALAAVVTNPTMSVLGDPSFQWNFAVTMVCFGYMAPRHGYKEKYLNYLPIAGTLIGAWLTFTVATTMGMALLTVV